MGKYDTEAKIRKAMQSEIPVSEEVQRRIDKTLESIGEPDVSETKSGVGFWNIRKVIAVCLLLLIVTNGKTIYTYAKDLLVEYNLYDMKLKDLNAQGSRGIVEFSEPAEMEERMGEHSEFMQEFFAEHDMTVVPYYLKYYENLGQLMDETGVKLLDMYKLAGVDQAPVSLIYSKDIARGPCEIFLDTSRQDSSMRAVTMKFYTKTDSQENPKERNYIAGNFTEKYVSKNKKLTAYLSVTEKGSFWGCYGYEDSTGKLTVPSGQEIYIREEAYGAYLLYDDIEYQIVGVQTVEEIKACIEQLSDGL